MASEQFLPAKEERNGKAVNWAWGLGCFLFQLPDYFTGQAGLGLSPVVHWPPAACHVLGVVPLGQNWARRRGSCVSRRCSLTLELHPTREGTPSSGLTAQSL